MSGIAPLSGGIQAEIAKDLREIQESVGASPAGNTPPSEFVSALERSLGEVNQLLNDADKKTVDLASGKSENIHETMISLEKAEASMKMMMQVRNKAIEAYHEVMRMQF